MRTGSVTQDARRGGGKGHRLGSRSSVHVRLVAAASPRSCTRARDLRRSPRRRPFPPCTHISGRAPRVAGGLILLGLAVLTRPAWAFEQPVSAFAANVGKRSSSDEPAPSVTLYVVPDGRSLLVTDVLVANHGQEPGPLYLGDSKRTLCSVELLQSTVMSNNPAAFHTLTNAHTTFSTGRCLPNVIFCVL